MDSAPPSDARLSLRDLRRDPLRVLAGVGDGIRAVRLGPPFAVRRALVVTSPAGVRRVLVERPAAYRKGPGYRAARAVLGGGLLTADGEEWRAQRRAVQPRFHRFRIEDAITVTQEETAGLVEEWRRVGGKVDAAAGAGALLHRVSTRVLFGVAAAGTHEFLDALRDAIEAVHRETAALAPVLARLAPRGRAARRVLRDAGAELLGRSRAAGCPGLLGEHLAPRADAVAERRLREEVMTFLLAGMETTANALAWTLHRLARHGGIQERVRASLEEGAAGAGAGEDLLHRTLQECLRLHPPGWILERVATEDDVVDGVAVRAGTVLWIVTYLVHRRPDVWPDPEVFDPDRFLPANAARRPEDSYLPFGLGPRACIGGRVALAELREAVAGILPAFTLAPVSSDPPVVEARAFSLRPRDGLPVAIYPRRGTGDVAASRNRRIRGTTSGPASSSK